MRDPKGWPKPSLGKERLLEERIARFQAEKRRMFGAPVWFVRGNMFAGVFADGIFARFSEEDRKEIGAEDGERFEPVEGRVMKEYMVMPEAMLGNKGTMDEWLDRSFAYVSRLPEKKRKR